MLIVIHVSYQHPYLFPLLQRNGTADYISQNSICHELAREIDSRPFKECCLFLPPSRYSLILLYSTFLNYDDCLPERQDFRFEEFERVLVLNSGFFPINDD